MSNILSKQDVLDIAVNFCDSNNRYPTFMELEKYGIKRSDVRRTYGNLETLNKVLAKECSSIFDLEHSKFVSRPKKSTKRFVVTTAVTGAQVLSGFLKNVKAYCEEFDAQLLVIPSQGNCKEWLLDPVLKDAVVVVEDLALNSNVSILGIKNKAKTTDPITGLPRVGQRNGTFISASPKQRLKLVPTGTSKLPHALMSTGAITEPNYASGFMADKSSYLADTDHVMGAVVLEIEDNNIFHYRQIQADTDGSFVDLGTLVKDGKFSKMMPEAFVLGDLHSGETDPVVMACWEDLSDKINPKAFVIHDGFSGQSINHHNEGKLLTLAKQAKDNKLSLKEELDQYVIDITNMAKNRNVVIVKSNHDEFLERYLNEGRYVNHPYNHRLALDLAAAYIDGHNPLRYYFESKKIKTKHKIIWLERDTSYKIAGIECGMHGDKGANGARGSANSLEHAYGPCTYGHTHTPEINRGAFCVGTSSFLQLDYNVGASSWLHTSCLVYPNGQRQLINCLEGKYTTRRL